MRLAIRLAGILVVLAVVALLGPAVALTRLVASDASPRPHPGAGPGGHGPGDPLREARPRPAAASSGGERGRGEGKIRRLTSRLRGWRGRARDRDRSADGLDRGGRFPGRRGRHGASGPNTRRHRDSTRGGRRGGVEGAWCRALFLATPGFGVRRSCRNLSAAAPVAGRRRRAAAITAAGLGARRRRE